MVVTWPVQLQRLTEVMGEAWSNDLIRLRLPLIWEMGAIIANHLVAPRTSALVAYEPGNATRYELAFVPFGGHTATVNIRGSSRPLSGCPIPYDWVLVAWVEHGAYPFRLLGELAALQPGYVASKLDSRCSVEGDGVALAALLAAIWLQAADRA